MEHSSSDLQIEAIGSEDLAPVVRRALGCPTASVVDWRSEVLQGGAGYIGSVYRLVGTAEDRGARMSWSVILKAIRGDPSEAPAGFAYWKREPLAYQSGLLDELPSGVFAPRCYGSVTTEDRAWLWLEDVRDDLGPAWPLEHFGIVACHLGRLNGTYLGDRERLGLPWVTTGWLAAWVERVAPVMADFTTAIDHPVFARIYSAEVADCMLRLWAARKRLLETLAGLPQTFCHLDAFRRNVIARRSDEGDMQSVLLDWAFVGSGALGEELASLVAATVIFDAAAHWEWISDLDSLVFNGYLDGLRDVGWHGDRDEVRFAYATATALRYTVGVTGFLLCDVDERGRFVAGDGWTDPRNQADAETMFGRPFDNLVEHFAGTFGWLTSLGEEALRTAPSK